MKKGFLLLTVFVASIAQAQQIMGIGPGMGILGTNFVAPTIAGKANVYDPAVGEIIYDSSDATFYGRTHSSTWAALGGSTNVIPTGSILTFAASSCPTGYLAADGSSINRTTYASLFTVIGTTHGQGDGSTTFNVPDYRGRFLRGVDGSANRDPDDSTRTAMATGGNTGDNVGSVQGDAFKSHTHIQDAHGHDIRTANGTPTGSDNAASRGFAAYNTAVGTAAYTGASVPYIIQTTATNQNTGGSETRPINAYVNFCIKY